MAAFLAGKPIDLNLVSQSVTFGNAISQPNGLSYFRKHNENELNALLTMIVHHGCSSFNVNMNLTGDQLAEVVSLIKSECWYLRPEEVVLVFKKAKMGEYGKIAFAVDISVIMGWFATYKSERDNYHIGRNNRMSPDTLTANVLAYSGEMALIKDQDGNEKEVTKEEIGESIKNHWINMQRVKDQANWKEPEYKKFEAEYYARKNADSRPA